MPTPLRVLILDDKPSDARLIVQELVRDGFDPQWQRVETEEDYLDHLDPGLDLILADYQLPQFDGLRALHVLQERGLDIPFIVVTGALGDEMSATLIKEGAADYLLKDRLGRLGQAVLKALEAKRLRNERNDIESLNRLKTAALQSAANAISITDRDGRILWVNRAFTTLTGYTLEEVLFQDHRKLKSGRQDPSFYRNLWETILCGNVWRGQLINRRKDGSLYTEEQTITPLRDDGGWITHFIAVKEDITERKKAEEVLARRTEDLARSNDELQRFNRSVVARELRMIELKRQVNELSRSLGRPAPYDLSFLHEGEEKDRTGKA